MLCRLQGNPKLNVNTTSKKEFPVAVVASVASVAIVLVVLVVLYICLGKRWSKREGRVVAAN